MTTTKANSLSTADLDRAASDDRYLGFGYLGGRRFMLTSTDPEAPRDPILVDAVDRRVIDWANDHGWTYGDLFTWTNSRNGRYFADVMFGGTGRLDHDFDKAVGWGLLNLPTD